jgi:hypothetical protein
MYLETHKFFVADMYIISFNLHFQNLLVCYIWGLIKFG